jgi:hydroxymethylpyrimidine pyrophosphatase-like HAD family hydrolase
VTLPPGDRSSMASRLRIVYTDLDGTLLGPGGSLFASPGGGVTGRAGEALEALHRTDVAVVPTSGRAEATVREAARVLGADGYVAELGGITVRDGEVVRHHGAYRGADTPYQAMIRSGAAGLLLDAYIGRLELHAPWSLRRECSMLFRGLIDLEPAGDVLVGAGYRWLTIEDNGIVHRRFPGLDVDEVHVYHLVPRGVSKAAAVAADLAARGLGPSEAIAVGDAPTDVALASHVGAVFVVANGAYAVGPDAPRNVHVTESANGEGFAEAVLDLLGQGSGDRGG